MTYVDDGNVGRGVPRFFGTTLREIGDWEHGEVIVEAHSPLGAHLREHDGSVHTGALLTLCDNVAGLCGGLAALPDGWVVSTNLMMRAADLEVVGPITLRSRVLRKGRNAVLTDVRVTDEGRNGAFVASGTLTSAILVPEGGPPWKVRPAAIEYHEPDVALPDLYEWIGLRDAEGGFELDVRPEIMNPWGIVHGGVTAALIDAVSARSVGDGARTHDAVVHYLAPARIGPVRATATPLGRRPDGTVLRVEVRDIGADRVTALAVTTVR